MNKMSDIYYKIEYSGLVTWSKAKEDGFKKSINLGNGYFRTRECHDRISKNKI